MLWYFLWFCFLPEMDLPGWYPRVSTASSREYHFTQNRGKCAVSVALFLWALCLHVAVLTASSVPTCHRVFGVPRRKASRLRQGDGAELLSLYRQAQDGLNVHGSPGVFSWIALQWIMSLKNKNIQTQTLEESYETAYLSSMPGREAGALSPSESFPWSLLPTLIRISSTGGENKLNKRIPFILQYALEKSWLLLLSLDTQLWPSMNFYWVLSKQRTKPPALCFKQFCSM